MKAIITACILFILNMPGLYAQAPAAGKDSLLLLKRSYNKEFIQVYKENADLSYTSPRGEIGAPQKYIITGKLTKTYMLLAIDKLPVAFAIIPDFTVKVIDEKSSGVRTPSFKLGGIFYFRLNNTVEHYKYASLRFTHHSNGQDGDALNPDGSINTRNGNFSTNYFTLGYNAGRHIPTSSDNYFTLNHYGAFEWHKWLHYEKALEDDYGFTRLIYTISLRKFVREKENWRMDGELNYAINAMSEYNFIAIKKRLNIETSFHYSFPFMNNVFIMAAAGYYGEDPYNIYYQNKYAYLRFGISSGL